MSSINLWPPDSNGFKEVTLSPELAQEGALDAGEQKGLAWQATPGHVPRTAGPLHSETAVQDGKSSGYCSG